MVLPTDSSGRTFQIRYLPYTRKGGRTYEVRVERLNQRETSFCCRGIKNLLSVIRSLRED
jgi:hypothetical protein